MPNSQDDCNSDEEEENSNISASFLRNELAKQRMSFYDNENEKGCDEIMI